LNIEPHDQDEIDNQIPPSSVRIASRALALAAVTARALLEQDDSSIDEKEKQRQAVVSWANKVSADKEFEPEELEILATPVGKLNQRTAINSTWRLEGLGVLAWALNLVEQAPYDELVDTGLLLDTLYQSASLILESPLVRTKEETEEYGEQIFALHWRLVEFSLNSEIMNFAEIIQQPWIGLRDLSAFHLIDGDLALGGQRIDKAPANIFSQTMSLAVERHHAINWLLGYNPVYSEIDTST
jgi:hypothetical protein